MAWVPQGWQPEGWQPDDWQEGMGVGSAGGAVDAHVIFRTRSADVFGKTKDSHATMRTISGQASITTYQGDAV